MALKLSEMIRIGYQGIEGSNSEEAARKIAKQLKLSEYELIPLVTSKTVIDKLKRDEIDYGVVATKNSLGGTVQETYDAIKNESLELIATHILQIHQCLFVKPGTPAEAIACIASHPQALLQTKNNRLKHYPNACEKEVEDTAIAAKYLHEGKLPETTAVLCRRNAGEMYDLELAYENMEDRSDNYTEFRMFKRDCL